MTLMYATGLLASYGDGTGKLARDSLTAPTMLPTTPTFNAAATTKPTEITQVHPSNGRNTQAQADAHAASEAAVLAIYDNIKTNNPGIGERIVVQDGWWDDPTTWGGTVPAADELAKNPSGFKLWVKASIPKIKCFLTDGFFGVWEDSSVNITIEIETFVGSRSSMFWIGDQSRPNMGSVTWTQPQTTLDLADDPNMQGKGIILLGRRSVYGTMVTPYIKTNGTDLMTGATTATLASTPVNWNVGDKIVIPATYTLSGSPGHLIGGGGSGEDDPGNETETRTIDTINGAVITWVGGLSFDHDMSAEAKTKGDGAPHINNLTRNITFDSPSAALVHERGHIMIMHANSGSTWAYAEHAHMGRTDKRVNAWSFSTHPDQPSKGGNGMTATSNIFGRYPLHYHIGGPDTADVSFVDGCSFHEGFGTGLVNHSSNVDATNNCSANMNGAHFMTEAGNEAGLLDGWVAIGQITQQQDWTNKGTTARQDSGQAQMFWFHSRVPEYKNFWAYGISNGTGWVANIRGGLTRDIRPKTLQRRNIEPIMRYTNYLFNTSGEHFDGGQSLISVAPLMIENATSVACGRPGQVIKSNSRQDHKLYSKNTGLRCYNCAAGYQWEYTGRYWINDVYGNQQVSTYGWAVGYETFCQITIEVFQFTFRNIEGYGFTHAVEINHVTAVSLGPPPPDANWHNFVIVNNSGTYPGTYRTAALASNVAADTKDVVIQENQLGTAPLTYTPDRIDVPNVSFSFDTYSGTVIDSLSTRTLPVGRDDENTDLAYYHGLGILKGHWQESGSLDVFMEVDELITDAGTGVDYTVPWRLYFNLGAVTNDPRDTTGQPAPWVPGAHNGQKA